MDVLIFGGSKNLESELKGLKKKIEDKGDAVTTLSLDYDKIPYQGKNIVNVNHFLGTLKKQKEIDKQSEEKIFRKYEGAKYVQLDIPVINFKKKIEGLKLSEGANAYSDVEEKINFFLYLSQVFQKDGDDIVVSSNKPFREKLKKFMPDPIDILALQASKQKAFFKFLIPRFEELGRIYEEKKIKDKTSSEPQPNFELIKLNDESSIVFKKNSKEDITANQAKEILSNKFHLFVYVMEPADADQTVWNSIANNLPLEQKFFTQCAIVGAKGKKGQKVDILEKGIFCANALNIITKEEDIKGLNGRRQTFTKTFYIDGEVERAVLDNWESYVFTSLNNLLAFNQAKEKNKDWNPKETKAGFGFGPKSTEKGKQSSGGGMASGDAGAMGTSNGVPTPPTESPEDKRKREEKIIAASTVRINEQAALMINSKHLIETVPKNTKGVTADIKAANERDYKNFAVYRNATSAGGHIDFTKNVFKTSELNYILKDLPPHVLSALTPAIKIYKVFYPEKKYFSTNSEGFSFRIPFDEIPVHYQKSLTSFADKKFNATSPFIAESQEVALKELLAGESRLHGVGIKSFRYKYVGTNPAEVNTNIEADLEIYMQDVRDIVKQIDVELIGDNFIERPRKLENLKFSYCDLVADVPAYNKEQYNNDYYRIKIMVGYSIPPYQYLYNLLGPEEATPQKVNKIIDALKKATVFLYLNPYNHDLVFEDNGSITLKIKYNAAITTQTTVLNCLEIAEKSYAKLKEASKKYEESLKEKTEKQKIINLNCYGLTKAEQETLSKKNTGAYEAILERRKTELEMNKNSLYSEIFSRLTGVRKNTSDPNAPVGRVFLATFEAEALGLTKSGELGSEDPNRPYYKILSKLRNVIDYEISSLNRSDPSWFLTEPPEILPAPTAQQDEDIGDSEANSDNPESKDEKQKSNYDKAIEEAKKLKLKKINEQKLKAIAIKYKIKDVKEQIASKGKAGIKENLELTKFIKEMLEWKKNEESKQKSADKEPKKDTKQAEVNDKGKQPEKDKNTKPDTKTSQVATEAQSKKNDEVNKSSLAPMTGVHEGKFGVKFVFLGDVFDIFCDIIKTIDYNQDRPKVILNNFSLEIPKSFTGGIIQYEQQTFNLADIPISIDMLRHFLMERMVKPRRSTYNLFTLFTNILSDILAAALSPRYFGTKSVLNRSVRMSMLGAAIPNRPSGKEAILGKLSTDIRYGGTITPKNFEKVKVHELLSIDNTSQLSNYLILYASNQLPKLIKENNGDVKKDEDAGIYHFYIGANKGIVKNIKFTRTNTPFYKEAKNSSSQGMSSLGRLQEVYNISITMFGNNIYKPGDFLYIESLFFSGREAVELQQKIGLGGYYQVIDVETKMGLGNYETVINAVLTGRINNGKVESLVEERACEDSEVVKVPEEAPNKPSNAPQS